MGNQRRSAQDRAKELKSNGLSLKIKMLWCDFCNVEVSHSRKSVIEKHVNSFHHKKRQADVKNVDPLPVVVGRQNAAKCIWSAMVASFTSAGVPLKIFRNPEKLLTQEGSKDIEKTTEMCCNQSVIATVDESIDIKNRKLLNVLIGWAKASSQLICLKSDNAKYMLTAGKSLKGLSSRMIHSTCWSHILHLVSEEIRGKVKLADKYISSFKSVLVKAPSRREELFDALEAKGYRRKLPPTPVITHNSAMIHTLKKICGKVELKEQLYKIHGVCAGIASAIKTLEKRDLPSCDVWLLLQNVLDLTQDVLGRKSFIEPGSDERLPSTLNSMAEWKLEFTKYACINPFGTPKLFRAILPLTFWETFSGEMPQLSELALVALSVPSSSSEVERSLLCLRRILTAQRNTFTEENVGIHLRLNFNQSRGSSLDVTDAATDNNVEFESDCDSNCETECGAEIE
ncbi:hypothetical protein Ocin01_15283 [Orchesella cincta]|uniref:HAT C-terminal dimerisation domain-containing protein n=1 Tax=Orchesella cincta TaxID=48709 RepID=A0A1D2MEK6_ORCCI|nr:hypothetical protein Ocin01_15283 [Orchesella cincta]